MKTRMITLLAGAVAATAMLGGTAGAAPQLPGIDEEGPGLAPNDPIVRVGDAVAYEADGHITFSVSLNKAATKNTTVDVAVSHGGTSASDFTGLVDQTAFFLGGDTGASVTLTLDGDDGVEPAENFTVVLSNADGLTIGDGVGGGTILDGDGPVLDIADVEAAEGEGELSFTVSASYAPLDDVGFDFLTGTLGFEAEPDLDFTPVSGVGVLPAGSTEVTVTVPVLDDDEVEDDELVIAFIENAAAGSIDDGTALGRILDDDVASPPAGGDAAGTDGTPSESAEPAANGSGGNPATGEQASGLTVDAENVSETTNRSIGLLLIVAGVSIALLSWLIARRIRENEQERRLAVVDPGLDATMHG